MDGTPDLSSLYLQEVRKLGVDTNTNSTFTSGLVTGDILLAAAGGEAIAEIAAARAGAAVEDTLSQATADARAALNVAARRNVAIADFNIDGNSGRLIAVSGQNAPPGPVGLPGSPMFDQVVSG